MMILRYSSRWKIVRQPVSHRIQSTFTIRLFHHTPPNTQAYPAELQTTDPLIAYRALASKGVLEEDAEQIRVLVELRKLTRILQDYTPPSHLLGILHDPIGQNDKTTINKDGPPASEENVNALVRYLSEEEQVENLETPRGMILTGMPGTGKSFLADLWFEHLPIQGKFKRHYHHMLLSIYRMVWVEAERRRIDAESQWGSSESVLPDRGVGVVWERQEQNQIGSRTKSISQWAKKLRGMPFLRAGSDSPPPVMSLDGVSLNDDANKGMDVIKLAQLERQEDAMAGLGTTLPMHVAAQLFLTHGHVLLLDELQLLDIASATLLRRILTSYWRLGGVLIATSNRVPEDLYANNVQRRSLVAFLGALKERCPVVEVSGRDRRIDRWKEGWNKFAQRGEKDDKSFFFLKSRPDEDNAFQQIKESLIANRQREATVFDVYNRKVSVPESYPAVDGHPATACYTFDQLCDQPLGPADYLTLSSTYELLILDDVPALDLVHRNQARRLITLIDCLYESRTKLIIRSQVPLTKIFFAREGAQVARENERRHRMAAQGKTPTEEWQSDDGRNDEDLIQSAALIQSEVLSEAAQDTEEGFRPNVVAYGPIVEDDQRAEPGRESESQREERQKGGLRNLSIFSGEEERFAYQRAVSRLYEMSHASWADVTWRPLIESDRSAWQRSSVQQDANFAADVLRKSAATLSTRRGLSSADKAEEGDFADEASYDNLRADQERKRVNRNNGPPVLSPSHVWGVREDWGPKAGKWGKGVRGSDDDGVDPESGESPRDRRARLREERLRASSDS